MLIRHDNLVWDAIVIGAGPAGTIAARRLALAGKRVLLVERKEFPRPKVCGGCINARAVSMLNESGLQNVLASAQAAPLDQLEITTAKKTLQIELPRGAAVSRLAFDTALLNEAVAAGVIVQMLCTAHVLEFNETDQTRAVSLQYSDETQTVRCRVVIAADGLQHPSLAGLPAFRSEVDPHSLIGLGATFRDDAYPLPTGHIRMCVGASGYVGIVRVEQGLLNVAAAVSASQLRGSSPRETIAAIVQQSGALTFTDSAEIAWQGTPALTRATPCWSAERLFLVGDATGYIEPFTGEGMSWAIESALCVAPLAIQCIEGTATSAAIADHWQQVHRQRLRSRQSYCRWIAWTLRKPARVRWGLSLAALFPAFTARIVRYMNAPLDRSFALLVSESLRTSIST